MIKLIVLVLIVVSIIVGIGALVRGRARWLIGVPLAAVIFVFLARSVDWRHQHYPAEITAAGDGASSADLIDVVEVSARQFHILDDHSRWNRDQEALEFRPHHRRRPDLETAHGSRLVKETIGDTEFAYWIPGPDGALVAFSAPAMDYASARREAERILEAKAAALALVEIKRRRRDLNVEEVAPLARRLARGWRSPLRFVELASQTTRRSYGRMYRMAAALQLEEGWLDRAVRELESEIQRGWVAKQEQARTWVAFGASVVCIAFLVFLLYTFFNAGTKGYFAWPLRIVSAGVFLAICVTIYWLRVHATVT